MAVTLRQKDSGLIIKAPTGFSWTSLFFGWFVPAFRGDYKWVFVWIGLAIVSFGFSWLIIPFVYNKGFIRRTMEKGYSPADDKSMILLAEMGLISLERE